MNVVHMSKIAHKKLSCGVELGVTTLPHRHVVSFQLRVLAGCCDEPAEMLGLARLLEDTLDKGTERRNGRELSDAFDAIGATRSSGAGRETTTFTCSVLPEHFETAIALHAELLREPTFPSDAVNVSVDLAKQELVALEDDAQGLLDKMISKRIYGSLLGRHPLGEVETLDRVSRPNIVDHWKAHFHAGRILASVAGPLDAEQVGDLLTKHFEGFGSSALEGRSPFPIEFTGGMYHHDKELEQQQIAIAWPAVDVTHDDFSIQQVVIGILSGGMSGRLFTEVREKRGLVYWVGAWNETPRGSGIMFLGASTTPQRCDETHEALLREVERLSEDLTQEELDRAVTGLVTGRETRGDTTRARCAELANDLFFFGRPVPVEKKVADLQAVTLDDIDRYLSQHPRDRLCTMTLGPRHLNAQPSTTTQSVPSGPQAEAIDR